MARRRKRTAKKASTAWPQYEETARHYKEASVLKPVSPSAHTDDWPCFLLSNATVHFPDGNMANQLEVDVLGPYVVRGKLELEKDNERYLVNRHMKTEDLWIQIDGSRAFSVGAKDDSLSVPVVWASGVAGWFEIVPDKSYQRFCNEMFDGVRLHYSFLDQYEAALETMQKSKKKKKATLADVSIDMDELLFQYALCSGDGLTLPEAYKRLHSHSLFLLSHFPKDTGLYKYLAAMFPDPVRIMANKGNKDAPVRKNPPTIGPFPWKAYDYDFSHREKSSSLDMIDGKKKAKDRPKASAPKSSRASEITDSENTGALQKSQSRQSYRSARTRRSPPTEIPAEDDVIMVDSTPEDPILSDKSRDQRAENHIEQSAPGPHVTAAKGVPRTLADALEDVKTQMIQSINEGKQKKQLHQISAKSWRTKVYMEVNIKNYNSTEEVLLYHARALVQHLGPEWYDTQIYQWIKENASKPAVLTLISEAEVQQIVRRVKKTARVARSENTAAENPRIEAREFAGKQTPKNRPSGKAAGLRPSTGSKKRLRYDAGFEDSIELDEDGNLKKKNKKSHYFTEEEEEEEDDDDDDDNDDIDEHDEGSSSESKPLGGKDEIPTTRFVIRAEKLPSIQPQGPNKTWICEEPDCGYIVRAAHEDSGRKLISDHFEEHEKEAQEVAQETALDRENLAVQEGTRGHMPINHLLEKIRNLGEKPKQRNEPHINGHSVPEPIKRTLFV
ncbi:hypothetical protein F4808DRAFT_410542 [Astrocystis sublimbata]|nr:hypothetical protein F4808DRAFT_410542 [Astrocystis sublimbata]